MQNKIILWITGVLLVIAISSIGYILTKQTPQEISKATDLTQVKDEKFPVWKTVTVGNYKTVDTLKTAIEVGGIDYFMLAQELIESPSFALEKTPAQIDLINVSASELGFLEPTTIKDVWNRAFELGLSLCPQEVGAQLLLQHGDDTSENGLGYEYPLAIASQHVSSLSNSQGIFEIGRTEGGALFLGERGTCIEPPPDGFVCVSVVTSEDRFVFMRTR